MRDFSEDFKEVLSLALPQLPVKSKTYLDIAGFSHYELVISNILAFFLDVNEEHGLSNLFLNSLLECLPADRQLQFGSEQITVAREFPGADQKRIDILVFSGGDASKNEQLNNAVIIENKIYASLYNSLEDYWSPIKAQQKVGVVLSLNPEPISHHGFLNVTYSQYIEKILGNLGRFIIAGNDKYIILLKDFIANIQSLKTNKIMADYTKFYFDNIDKINELSLMRDQILKEILAKIEVVGRECGYEIDGRRADNYRYWYLGEHDVYFFVWVNAFDLVANKEIGIALEFYDKMRPYAQTLIENKVLVSKYEKKGIKIYSHRTDGRSFIHAAVSTYKLDSDFMINFEFRLKEIVNSGWKELYDEVLQSVTSI